MSGVVVITDGGACLPPHRRAHHDIEVVPFVLIVHGRRVDPASASEGDGLAASTAQPSPGEFLEAFKRASERGHGIVSIHIARELSSSYWAAQVASQEMRGFPIRVLDSRTAAVGQGLLVLRAAELAGRGAAFREVVEEVQRLRQRVRVLGTVRHLDRLRRSGRVNGALLGAASRLGLQPVFSLERGRVRLEGAHLGPRQALRAMMRDLASRVSHRPFRVGVGHADAAGEARELLEAIRGRLAPRDAFLAELDPLMRLWTGPGAVVVGFHAEPMATVPLEIEEPVGMGARRPVAPTAAG